MSNRRNAFTLTGQVMASTAPLCLPPGGTWDFSAVPVAENPRFDVHPDSRPSDLFSVQPNGCSVPAYRFVNKRNPKQMLMFIDGTSMRNGTSDARAAWAVCVGPQIVVKNRLGGVQTSNRAELRAAIAALGLRVWRGEDFTSVVLATDSEYVIKGFCENLPRWKSREWRTSAGTPVVNKDLWVILDKKVESVAKTGTKVLFWWISRRWNEADQYAKEAANLPPVTNESGEGPIMVCM